MICTRRILTAFTQSRPHHLTQPIRLTPTFTSIRRHYSTDPLPVERQFSRLPCSFAISNEFKKEYTLGRFLGAGAFTEVYEAVHKLTNQTYAVKFLPKDDIDPVLPYSFESETAPNLSHPHLLSYMKSFDAPPTDSSPPAFILIMEYFGHRLRTYTETYGLPSIRTSLLWIRQLTSALAYLHSKGIRHGDIRPSNIHVDGDEAKLMDLGMACHVGDEGEVEREALEEDVRSLGRVCLEILGGRTAAMGMFDGSTGEGLARMDARGDVPKELRKALHEMYEGTTPTAQEFLDRISSIEVDS
ncbi:kinase-like domain-containing protein [Phlyctochytrium arcticum]|nr:kinase-like domain-containing protein [Phlyctochytrium arcticum]KAI9098063.1 kinase-like domain-containing protein [Phlyctochytrium arcticum]